MAKEKVYTPETIDDISFPTEVETVSDSTQSTSGGVIETQQIKSTSFPKKVIASETIGVALNTKTRKILGEFDFEEKGALQIGKYENDVSGDIKVSPAGIVARNSSGNNTFALDGETGDAVFKGIIQAANFVVADENGLVSLNNFSIDSVESYGSSRTTDSTTFTDLANTTLSFTLLREARVLFLCSANAGAASYANWSTIRVFLGLNVDGIMYPNDTYGFNAIFYWNDSSDAGYTAVRPFWSGSTIVTLPAGTHTAKLQFHKHLLDNLTAEVIDTSLTYIILGS